MAVFSWVDDIISIDILLEIFETKGEIDMSNYLNKNVLTQIDT